MAGEGGAYTAELVTQRISTSSTIAPLGDDLFGDQTDWYTGSTSFSVTDVSLPGNGSLPVAVGRTHRVGAPGPLAIGLFGNWDIDIPHIYANFLWNPSWEGGPWGWAAAPCSQKRTPEYRYYTLENNPYTAVWIGGPDYWDGNRMHIPGAGDRLMLVTKAGVQVPQDGGSYPWTTTDNWRFSCIPIKRGSGEGFLARSPDGVRYYFDIAVGREVVPLIWRFFTDRDGDWGRYAGWSFIHRQKVYLYPSRIEDRFGNSVDYNWDMSSANDARLNSIVANDGRRIDIKYKWIDPVGGFLPEANGYRVDTVTANGKSWRYDYNTGSRLTTVTLPDQSTWVLSPEVAYPEFTNGGADPCNGLTPKGDIFTYTMKHPSGAQGKFQFVTILHGRANVYPKCEWNKYLLEDKNASPGKFIGVPSLRRKELSGPGMSPRVWTVAWNSNPANDASWLGENTGDTKKIVEATGPAGIYTRYTFSNDYGRDEGKLLKQETGTGQSFILSTTEQTYDVDSPSPAYIREVGTSPGYKGDNPLDGKVIPLRSSKMTRDGTIFSTTVESYDSYARPTQIKRTSEAAPLPPPAPDPIDPPPPCPGCQVQ